MPSTVKHFYEFGEFRLDADRHRLLRNGEVIPLAPKAIETLFVLVQNPGKLLEREELIQAVWADTFVEDANLTVAISNLRKALGQNGRGVDYIETIPRVGYRFVANVTPVEDQIAPLIIEKHTISKTVIEEEFIAETDKSLESPAFSTTISKLPTTESKALLANQVLPARSIRHGLALSRSQWVIIATVLMVGTISIFIYSRMAAKPKLPATIGQVKSMAVLPFKTLHSNSDDEYLGLGLADALITQLGRMREVAIRPLSAVRKYEGLEHDPLAIGGALGVEAVLEGSVQHEGEKLRVTMRLLRVADGVVLWSGKFDEKFSDFFTIQDSISQQVAQASVLNLSREEKERLTKRYTTNQEAHRLYLKGRYFWNKRSAEGLQRSFDYFQQAIANDPGFALAYAGLADAYAVGVWQNSLPQKVFIPRAKAAATRALEIDYTVGEAHASLGFVKLWYEWDFGGAESAFRRAIELSPNYATAHQWYGELLMLTGRTEEGFKELKLAQQADPLSVIISSDLGKMLFFTGQTDQAIEQLKNTVELDPSFPIAHLFLALAYHEKGMTDEAIGALESEANINSSRTVFKFVLGYIYARIGRRAEAEKILNELQRPGTDQFTPAYGIALIHVGLGQKDEAFLWLERSRIEQEPFLTYINVDRNFNSLRDDPRFSNLLQRIGF